MVKLVLDGLSLPWVLVELMTHPLLTSHNGEAKSISFLLFRNFWAALFVMFFFPFFSLYCILNRKQKLAQNNIQEIQISFGYHLITVLLI